MNDIYESYNKQHFKKKMIYFSIVFEGYSLGFAEAYNKKKV